VKVVIFCGGQGLRMREASDVVPKPMVPIGNRPVLWHVMKYYAHFGFTDFVLCLGYKAEAIKHFFLTYNEAMANDFVLSEGGARVHLLKTDIHNWNITFVDTGLNACIGERLRAVRHLLRDDEMFLANYGDTLTDADLPAMIARTRETGATASFLAVRPNYSFHVVSMDDGGIVDGIHDVTKSDVWINGGYFVLRSELLDDIRPGEELVEEPFHRLLARDQLLAQRPWTRSKTSSGSRACTRAVKRHGNAGLPGETLTEISRQSLSDAAAPRAPARRRAAPAARDRRTLRRHRDRLRRNDPQADRAGCAGGGLLGRLDWREQAGHRSGQQCEGVLGRRR
jgi:glucose-1-phosphate cytidylyltransferase